MTLPTPMEICTIEQYLKRIDGPDYPASAVNKDVYIAHVKTLLRHYEISSAVAMELRSTVDAQNVKLIRIGNLIGKIPYSNKSI